MMCKQVEELLVIFALQEEARLWLMSTDLFSCRKYFSSKHFDDDDDDDQRVDAEQQEQ